MGCGSPALPGPLPRFFFLPRRRKFRPCELCVTVAVVKLRGDCDATACDRSASHRSDIIMAVVSPMKLRCIGHDDVTTSGNEPPRCHTHDHRHWPQVELRILAIPCSSMGPVVPSEHAGDPTDHYCVPRSKSYKKIHRYALKNILRQRVWAADRLHCLGRSQDY